MKKILLSTDSSYRLLFPTALFCLFSAGLVWPIYFSGLLISDPSFIHSHLMIYCGFYSFISGFLLTVLPQMTNTRATVKWEVRVALLSVFIQLLLILLELKSISILFFGLEITFLFYFTFSRVRLSHLITHNGFLYVLSSYLMVFFGVAHYFFIDKSNQNISLVFTGTAFISNIILGFGIKLIPIISRIPLQVQIKTQYEYYHSLVFHIILVLLFNSGYFLEWQGYVFYGEICRFIPVLILACFYFKTFNLKVSFSYPMIGLKLGVVFLLLGSFKYNQASSHFIYLGGFTLITLMIASRIVLAHGGYGIGHEQKEHRLGFVILAIFFSVIFRVMSDILNQSELLVFSSLLFLISIYIWSLFLFKYFKK